MRKLLAFVLFLVALLVTSGCHNPVAPDCSQQGAAPGTLTLGKHHGDGIEYIGVWNIPQCKAEWEAQGYVTDHEYDCMMRGGTTPGGNPQMGEVTLHKGAASIDVPTDCVDVWMEQGYK
jgi:hypothetical protein